MDGSVVILQSRASGKTLRSFHGTAQGVGGFGVHGMGFNAQRKSNGEFPCISPAQWKVHVRRTGVIALQNIHTSEHWLAIHNGKTIGNVCTSIYLRLIHNMYLFSGKRRSIL